MWRREEDREGTGAGAGLVVQRILTPDELGIGSSSTGMADVIFAWVPLKPYKNQEQNWHGASNYEGADPDVRACSSGGDHTPSCRVCVFIIWPFLFAMPMICCMCAYSMCMRAFRPPPPLPTDIPLQAVFVNVSPARDERLVERIQALPTSLEPPANGDVCGICLESQADAPWRLLPCGHRFHMSCVGMSPRHCLLAWRVHVCAGACAGVGARARASSWFTARASRPECNWHACVQTSGCQPRKAARRAAWTRVPP